MTDIASLGLRIDSSQAKKASSDLDRLSASSAKAEGAAKRLEGSEKRVAVVHNELAGTARAAALAQDKLTMSTTRGAAAAVALGAATQNVAHRQRMLMFQINDIGTSLATGMSPFMILAQQGGQVQQIYAGQGGVRAALSDVKSTILGVARAHPILTAATVTTGAAFAGLTYEINQASDVAVTFGDVVGGVFDVAAERIKSSLGPVIDALAPGFATVWDAVVQGVKFAGNGIINSFSFAVESIKLDWQKLPSALGDITIRIANGVVGQVQKMINAAIGLLNEFIDAANAALRKLPESVTGGFQMDTVGPVRFEPFTNTNEGAAAELARQRADLFSIFQRDPLGELFTDIKNATLKRAFEGTGEAATTAGRAAKEAADQASSAWKAANDNFSDARSIFSSFFSDLSQGLQNGEKFWEAFRKAGVNALNRISERMLAMASDRLFGAFLGAILGGGGAGTGGMGLGFGKLYAAGGYTGPGNMYQPAGIVHAGEYVMTAAATRKIGVRNLDALNYGYAHGGLVTPMRANQNSLGGGMHVNIYNQSGSKVETQSRRGSNGEDIIDVMIGKVNGRIARGDTDQAMRARFGAMPQKIRR